MTRPYAGYSATLLVLASAACGAGGGEEAERAGDVGAQVRACDALDLQGASRVIGPGTENPGGDTEQLTCIYVNPGVAMLTVQLGPAEWYDQVTILQPHTPVDVGDRARSNTQETGVVALQFVAGAHSATLSVQPIGAQQTDYLELLVTAAREMTDRLP